MKNKTQELSVMDRYGFTEVQAETIKNMICKNANETEMIMFLETCRSLNLSPFLKEVYFFKNSYKNKNGESISTPVIGIGINGYRKIAERTGQYAPGKAVEYRIGDDNLPISATAYVKKLTKDGTWHEVSATVYGVEYKKAVGSSMPFHKLGLNAESFALRKAFPESYNGIYSKEEIETSNFPNDEKFTEEPKYNEVEEEEAFDESFEIEKEPDHINSYQVKHLKDLLELDPELNRKVRGYLASKFSLSDLAKMNKDIYPKIIKKIVENLKKNKKIEVENGTGY